MSISLRVTLIIGSIIACLYVIRKLRKSQIGLIDMVFWINLFILFIVLSIFPQIAEWGATLFGFIAPVNFIFLIIIFLLVLRCFLLTLRISQLEDKLCNLIEEIAIRETEKKYD